MNKLVVCACENIAPEIAAALSALGQEDIRLEILPCICLSRQKKKELTQQLLRIAEEPADRLLLCGNQCGTIDFLAQVKTKFEIIMNSSCFGHLIANELFGYITEKGGYIVSAGWLKNWRVNLAAAGFDDGTAKIFFGEFAKELVFLDTGLSTELRAELQELSVYIDIPVRILPIDAEKVKTMLQKQILEWRYRNTLQEYTETIKKLRVENAEYASLLHMMKGISKLNKNREVISRMQEIFMAVFGAKNFIYAADCCDEKIWFEGIEDFLEQSENIVFFKETNMVAAKIMGKARLLGLIRIEGFLFPQYIERYLELFSGILQIFAVVLQNLRYIENIEQQKSDLFYLNIRDAQTKLYNRRYFEEELAKMDKEDTWALFVCDMDGLKQINDNYGHAAGDEALMQAGILLKETFRESDVAARIGGDEFAVIVRDCDRQLAQRLQLRLAKNSRKYANGDTPKLHLSSGYAVKNVSGRQAIELFKRADSNMYKIKKVYKAIAKKFNKL